jgi:hypothetical protein
MALSEVYCYTPVDTLSAVHDNISIHNSWFPLLNKFVKKWELLMQAYQRATNLIPSVQFKILEPFNNIIAHDIEVVWFEHEPNQKGWGGDTMNYKFKKTFNTTIDELRQKNHIFVFKCWSAIINSDNDSAQFWHEFNINFINLMLLRRSMKFVIIGPDLKKITSYIKKYTDRVINVEDPRIGYVQNNLEKFEKLNEFLSIK